MGTRGTAVLAEGLQKIYKDTKALDGFDLAVPEGTVCGLLGPNGAGKTTAVRILTTLLRADGGRATVAGYEVGRESAQVRARIGLTGQYSAVDDILTGRDNLVMFGRLYHLGKRRARERADELLDSFALTEAADRQVKTYSGGMRRRLDLAASIIVAPQVLFLDEPSTGLDPRNRNKVWDDVRQLVARGTTVLLTTQYLDEADQLASQIAVIEAGRVIADGTPDQLKTLIGGDQIGVVVQEARDIPDTVRVLASVTGAEPKVEPDLNRVSAPAVERVAILTSAVRALDEAGIAVEDIALRRPSLDEVFLRLTGNASPAPSAAASDELEKEAVSS
ncbi:ATP-binding cassette domain-containing protein [Streptomyces radicis]|uniref:ABC-type xenobiotic transporter n=1 Tax=Streptomyces radicis TaxID=1750517 RepID=A0A3A9WF49_9ACTN|nr:ATP-binding cassette domain-containing protein [Streptomyces radicis]RKN04697.1 ATP-binding cassette domain-containing protein [Streptomyces radicis]RKN15629.1 ATP-binding cassette domain-containing protein [Streptomyces radicis]